MGRPCPRGILGEVGRGARAWRTPRRARISWGVPRAVGLFWVRRMAMARFIAPPADERRRGGASHRRERSRFGRITARREALLRETAALTRAKGCEAPFEGALERAAMLPERNLLAVVQTDVERFLSEARSIRVGILGQSSAVTARCYQATGSLHGAS